jgi:hypothetical protein
MLKTAREIVALGDERLVVDYAVEADRQIKATKAEFETAKDFLRLRAADIVAHTNEPTAQLKGSSGSVVVSFQKPQAAVRKGVDPLAFEQTMDPSLWSTFFRKRVVVEVADDAEAKLATLTPAQRAAMLNLIEIRTDVPRVTVKQG